MVAVSLATLCYLYTKLNYGYFSVITSFILVQAFYSEILIKIIERILGPTIAFMLAFGIIYLFHSYFIPYFILSLAIVFLFSYYYALGFYPYAMLWALMTTAIMTDAAYVDSEPLGIILGSYWVLNIVIGSLIVLITLYSFKKFKKPFVRLRIFKKKSMLAFFKAFKKINRTIHPSAMLVACRITLTLLFISIINYFMNWGHVSLPALIAGAIISAQLTLQSTHHRAIFRMTGVLLGTLFAILYVLILLHFPSTLLEGLFIIGSLTLCIFLAEKFPYLDYVFLQLGIVIPLILIHPNTGQYNITLTLYRGFGSLEGGIIGMLMEYLFYFPLKRLGNNK